jgi:bisphosphoglycerate-dependent phosphoglycerate mutase family 1
MKRSTSATMAISPASTRMTPARSGARSRFTSGAAPTTCRRPDGESLKDTGARVWPYYMTEILPRVLRGETVLVAAHGNSLRSLLMILDRLSREQILSVNLATGVPMVYKLNADSTVASKEVLGDMSKAH